LGYSAGVSLGAEETAGSFVVGRSYRITVVGSTNFVAIGADSNAIGVNFIATGAGSGTGKASATSLRTILVGASAAANAIKADDCVGIGGEVFPSLTVGSKNVAVGPSAGTVTTGSNNLELATTNPGGGAGIHDVGTNSNRIVMGNNEHTNAYVKVSWTVTSDARDKTSFASVPHGLAFVQALQPTAYRFRTSRNDAAPLGPVRYGFLAQDILALEGADNVVIDTEDADHLKYNEASMIPILVKAIQELKAEFDAYKLARP
jgi:hypothetical protein